MADYFKSIDTVLREHCGMPDGMTLGQLTPTQRISVFRIASVAEKIEDEENQ